VSFMSCRNSGVNPFFVGGMGGAGNFIWRQTDIDSFTFLAPVFFIGGRRSPPPPSPPWIDSLGVVSYYRPILTTTYRQHENV